MSASSPATFLFADIAGFTALTEVHGDEDAAELAGEFSRCVAVLLPELGGTQVKAIGDALMIRVTDARNAVRLGLAIVYDAMRDHLSPSVRVGMHTGPAVERDGDWFGAAVNTAARISALASGGEVLVSEATRRLSGDGPDFAFRSHGRHRLHNIKEPVVVFAALRRGESDGQGLPIDPVCRMAIDPRRASGVLVHEGTEYLFCSFACVEMFARTPGEYTAQRQRRPSTSV